jgi:hypothetical protein
MIARGAATPQARTAPRQVASSCRDYAGSGWIEDPRGEEARVTCDVAAPGASPPLATACKPTGTEMNNSPYLDRPLLPLAVADAGED